MADQQSDSGQESKQSYAAKQLMLETTKTAFLQLSGLLKNVTLYPASHPYLISLTEKMLATIERLLATRNEVAFYFLNGELFFETSSVPIDENTAILMDLFETRNIGGIVFKPGITITELIKLAILTSREPAAIETAGGIIEAASRENITNIQFHRGVELVDKKIESKKPEETERKANELYMDTLEALKEITQNVYLNKTISMRRMSTAIQTLVDNIQSNRDAFLGLTNIKMHDEYTYAHLVNTSILAISLASFLSLEKRLLATLGIAAIFHDIGKVRVPDDITKKLGYPTDEEWTEVERHPIEGALICSNIPGISKMAAVTAFEHHQHGGIHGYPATEGSVLQHLFSQIVSIVDAYDVLTSSRVYFNSQISPEQVIKILIKKRESDFNKTLVKTFINMIGIFPIGSLLKFTRGEIGLVVRQTSDLIRPRILMIKEFNGSGKETGEAISLLETFEGSHKWNIAGTLSPEALNIDIKKYLESFGI